MRAGGVYHVISRFVAKEWFVESSVERTTYLSMLGLAIAATDWRCFSFAIMSNHIHLALEAGSVSLRSWMRPMHTDFAEWINIRRERIGAVFVRGPNVHEVYASGAARLINYIHCNPVRAGLVSGPADSDWTSHRAYLGLDRPVPWLDVDHGVELAGFGDPSGLANWIEHVETDRQALRQIELPRRAPGRPPKTEKAKPAEQEAGFFS